MASAAVEICNLALIKIGNAQLVQDLSQQTTEARVCNALYPIARDRLLASWWWGFATARQTLAQLSNVTRDGWSFCYQYPPESLQPRFIFSGQNVPTKDTQVDHSLEASDSGLETILCTNASPASLVYTRRVVNVNLYPPLFVEALARLLAVEMVTVIPVKPELAPGLNDLYLQALMAAKANDANGQREARPSSSYESARGGGSVTSPRGY